MGFYRWKIRQAFRQRSLRKIMRELDFGRSQMTFQATYLAQKFIVN